MSDLIDRQAAISAICNACGKIDCDQVDKCEKLFTTQEAAVKQGEIRLGDEVERYINGKLDSKGIYLQEDGGYWRCLFDTGAVLMTFAYPKGQFKKTGKHYDIQSILEAMRK